MGESSLDYLLYLVIYCDLLNLLGDLIKLVYIIVAQKLFKYQLECAVSYFTSCHLHSPLLNDT